MVAKRRASSAPPTNVTAVDAASAASFQPLNPHTKAGARKPSGLYSQRNGCIRSTVHHGEMRQDRSAISSLRAGDQIDGVFACTRKDRLTTRSGSPYLALELRDRTGAMSARAFRDADALAGRFDRGELVRATGTVERFRDDLVLEVAGISRADDGDPALFLPSSYRDLDELEGFLEHLSREVYDRSYRALLDRLLGDGSLRAALRRAPCTRAGHHAYL